MMKKISLDNYLPALKKLAWSFHLTTGVDYEELLSAAFLGYAVAEKGYDPGKGTAFITYLYRVCRSHMIDYVASLRLGTEIPFSELGDNGSDEEGNEDWAATAFIPTNYVTPEDHATFRDTLANLGPEARAICEMILESPSEWIDSRPKKVRGRLLRALQSKGWGTPRIYKGFRELKHVLSQTA